MQLCKSWSQQENSLVYFYIFCQWGWEKGFFALKESLSKFDKMQQEILIATSTYNLQFPHGRHGHHRGEREFPFPVIPKNGGLWFPFPNFGNGFFHSLPVPDFWEWVFSIPFPFPNPQKSFPLTPALYRELTSFFQVRNLKKMMIWSIFILLRNIGKMLNWS